MTADPVGLASDRLSELPERLYAYGFSLRKRPLLRRFLGGRRVSFILRARQVPAGAGLLLWGSKPPPHGLASGVQLVRVEDGFLRSVGLGADLVTPVSWVIDRRGIYYDASQPSDLEWLLQTTTMDAPLLARAGALRERLVREGVTKYNVGGATWRRPAGAERVVLVPGQVETDAAIRLGAPGVCSNMGLLQAVRAACPDAYVLYKPHPDVVAGLRKAGVREDAARQWCDEIVVDVPMAALLEQVDAVHVLTSLTGFEALLRGKPVTCYGQPFYAGWGLTTDMLPLPRRARRLTLNALVAGTLILYPTYASRSSGRLTGPEGALDELIDWRNGSPAGLPFWRTLWRWLVRSTGAT